MQLATCCYVLFSCLFVLFLGTICILFVIIYQFNFSCLKYCTVYYTNYDVCKTPVWHCVIAFIARHFRIIITLNITFMLYRPLKEYMCCHASYRNLTDARRLISTIASIQSSTSNIRPSRMIMARHDTTSAWFWITNSWLSTGGLLFFLRKPMAHRRVSQSQPPPAPGCRDPTAASLRLQPMDLCLSSL